MTLSSGDINEIVRALQETTWDEAVVSVGEVKIALARNGATLSSLNGTSATNGTSAPSTETQSQIATTPQESTNAPVADAKPLPASVTEAAPAESSAEDVIVKATSVGIFWEAPEPGAEPFVKVGEEVKEDDVVCIVEIMKLMSHITAGTSGVITKVLAENGQAVEMGTPLFSVRPLEA